ncbi:AraC family transcriptional regulator, partial [Salmonella enterica subsp. enterica]|nr:AraC family transcriptional regulator [Salmonella enterica]EBV5822422.1 AraC family transcriptional regulator [Salmonella enterica subsp. enterica serovar Cubana]ECF7044954.1 AraC family transcriptional regulator [Salmonella enterica subsp. enterica]EAT6832195.1 AraC family transcriptional regulator [Salmonella enterica]EBN7034491.1 AraC family transcriptional regulator [Salmonella enterica]
MRRVIDATKCTDMMNCDQGIIGSVNKRKSDTGMLLNHIYVTNTILIKLSRGILNIKSSENEVLNCCGECLILIEKNQTLSIRCSEVNNHLDFKIIYISYKLMNEMYSLFISREKLEDR